MYATSYRLITALQSGTQPAYNITCKAMTAHSAAVVMSRQLVDAEIAVIIGYTHAVPAAMTDAA